MNIAVLVKWVPEPQGTPTLGPDRLLVREGADGALDPGDEYGLERALQLVERDGGEVTLVSMGPEVAVAAVQRGLAMGAHRAVLVTDDALRGADTLVTARVLAAALRPIGADLVVAAVESTDGYTGTLPITVAVMTRRLSCAQLAPSSAWPAPTSPATSTISRIMMWRTRVRRRASASRRLSPMLASPAISDRIQTSYSQRNTGAARMKPTGTSSRFAENALRRQASAAIPAAATTNGTSRTGKGR